MSLLVAIASDMLKVKTTLRQLGFREGQAL